MFLSKSSSAFARGLLERTNEMYRATNSDRPVFPIRSTSVCVICNRKKKMNNNNTSERNGVRMPRAVGVQTARVSEHRVLWTHPYKKTKETQKTQKTKKTSPVWNYPTPHPPYGLYGLLVFARLPKLNTFHAVPRRGTPAINFGAYRTRRESREFTTRVRSAIITCPVLGGEGRLLSDGK